MTLSRSIVCVLAALAAHLAAGAAFSSTPPLPASASLPPGEDAPAQGAAAAAGPDSPRPALAREQDLVVPSRPKAEEALAGVRVRLSPPSIRPGTLFQIDVDGADLKSAAATVGSRVFPLYEAGPGRFRGFATVPIDHRAGRKLVHVAVVGGDLEARSASVPLEILARKVASQKLTVNAKFTSPSARHVAQMKSDRKALRACYQVPFGPPRFSKGFVDPLGNERGSRFGERRVFNGRTRSRHWGLDIDGRMGEPVRAANDGLVVLARPCFMSGLTVIVSHGAGLFTGYFHFSRFEAKVGQTVRRGEVLGYVGSTGRSTGPHLHFSAKLHGALIDPEALLDFEFDLDGEEPLTVGAER